MADIFYVHWNETEAGERARILRAAGHRVRVHWSTQTGARIEPLPDVLVVSLDRLPSHGRAVAEWLGEARRQHVPIVFVGGAPDKVAATRTRFPQSIFCAETDVARAVAKVAVPAGPGGPAPRGAPRTPRSGSRRRP